MGGDHRCEGRVELQQDDEWVTVCDDYWNMDSVAVLCRELGCGAARKTMSGTMYGPVTPKDQKVFIHLFRCNGIEESLSQCEREDAIGCSHVEDVGVVCERESHSPSGQFTCLSPLWTRHAANWLLTLHVSPLPDHGPCR